LDNHKYEEIQARPPRKRGKKAQSLRQAKGRYVPPPDHPWRKFVFGKKALLFYEQQGTEITRKTTYP
jgi:hypothetical protein